MDSRARASSAAGSSGELCTRRSLLVRAGFTNSCLQSEMIRLHMPVQPDSYSPRHMFKHLLKSQLTSTPRADVATMKIVTAKTKRRTRRMQKVPRYSVTSSRIACRVASCACTNNDIMMNAVLGRSVLIGSSPSADGEAARHAPRPRN